LEILFNNKPKELTNIELKPIIDPMKRDAYPEGISDYKRDEILWNEARMIKDKYPANFLEGMIFNMEIYLTINLSHHYKVFVDFSDYPSKPIIDITEGLKQELGKNLEELLNCFSTWDPKVPPHIIEIINELEAVLKKLKNQGKLSNRSEIPKSALPELMPLPKVNSIKEKKEK